MLLFSELNKSFFGCFYPGKILQNNENIYFQGELSDISDEKEALSVTLNLFTMLSYIAPQLSAEKHVCLNSYRSSVLPFQPKHRFGQPEYYLFLLSNKMCVGSKYPKTNKFNWKKTSLPVV